MRIILYTGKGGVGKTSVAAATAVRCAELGYRTIILSTDAAHSLADSFDIAIGKEPIELAPKLWGQEIDVLYQMDKYWGTVQAYFRSILQWRGVDELIADEVSVLPGMEELASLLQIVYLAESKKYDVIIVDCAPTGETLKLLSLPEVARWYLTHIFPAERLAMRLASPFMRNFTDIPMPDDQVFETIKELIQQLDRMHKLLSDTKTSSVRIVLNPEKMVIRESQRTFTYINLYGFACDLIVSNRVLSDSVTDIYFAALKEAQARYGQLITESFTPVPIFQVPFLDQEVVGLAMLQRVAAILYGDQDPSRVFYEGQPQEIVKNGAGYLLKMNLPFASKEDVHLTRAGDELAISVGNFRRNTILPRALAALTVQKAKMEEGKLVVSFA
ncbi:MAG: hypothetical protein HDKAJFGB_00131 [Anaerolineae bacterium]|nr:hypothetical protein [Anaerolineae bacterium]RIK34086.1 MAG: arsenic-transporting ATPase [Chloroflexota bacterium]